MTEGLSIVKSKTVTKVEPGTEVEGLCAPVKDEGTNMLRVECKILSGAEAGKSGWVSLRGNQGTTYLQAQSPFSAVSQDLDEKSKAAEKTVKESQRAVRIIFAQVPRTARGPLRRARGELRRIGARIAKEGSRMRDLKARLASCEVDFFRKGDAERETKSTSKGSPRPTSSTEDSPAPLIKFKQELPFYVCMKKAELQDKLECAGASTLRTLERDELVEVLEAPTQQLRAPAVRAKVEALSDGTQGFLTVRDPEGIVLAEQGNFMRCVASVAMTSSLDIKKGKTLRKLAEGELVEVLEGPLQDGDSTIARFRGRALEDGKDGWVTPKGNAGSTFMAESTKHYIVRSFAFLEKQAMPGCTVIRELAVGEVVAILAGPKEVKVEPIFRARCRVISDDMEGWFTLRPDTWQLGSKMYQIIRAVVLQSDMEVDGEAVRALEVGTVAELLQGPLQGPGAVFWIKAKTVEEDSNTGWLPIRDDKGLLIQPCRVNHR